MTTPVYVRSTDGSDASNGSTWADAKATLSGATDVDEAGGVVYVSDAHAESTTGASHAWAGTLAAPMKIIAGDDAAEPPTALSTAATVTTTGTTFGWTGSVYTYGLKFIFTSLSSFAATFNGGNHYQVLDSCAFRLGTGGASTITFGANSSSGESNTLVRNCTFKAAAAGQSVAVSRTVRIEGGSWESGGTSPTGVFRLGYGDRGSPFVVDGFDFSNLAQGVNLVQFMDGDGTKAFFRNCKLPSSWNGALVASGVIKLGARVEMHNCDAGDTNYRLLVHDYAGTIEHETTIVRTGGASDGTTTISWEMVSAANAEYPTIVLSSPEIVQWNELTGSSKNVTVEFVHDSATALKDNEIWLEVLCLSTSGVPLGAWTSNRCGLLTTAADTTDSSETWTTTGLTNPNTRKLTVAVTPQEKGYIHARVCLAKANTTVWVDPKLTVA